MAERMTKYLKTEAIQNLLQKEQAGEYLKTKKRCKTALVTELVHAWMKNGETAVNTVSSTGSINIEDIKRQLLQDKDFLSRIEKSMTETGNQNKPESCVANTAQAGVFATQGNGGGIIMGKRSLILTQRD